MEEMKSILFVILGALVLLLWANFTGASSIKNAFDKQKSNIQVKGSGKVIHVLPDDIKGSRHQKFLLKLDTGLTILIAHNIDLAPRIKSISKGDTVKFFGEYEWTNKGGVVHWTLYQSI